MLPRLKTDLIESLQAVREERLADMQIQWSEKACACVVMASGGYPGSYPKGLPIEGLAADGQLSSGSADVTVFHAGTKWEGGRFVTAGGRVLGVTATADALDAALDKAYEAVGEIRFENAHYRKDIGRTR